MSEPKAGAGIGVESSGSATRPESPSDDSADTLTPEVKSLIEKGKERGFVTYDELNKVLPDDLVSPEKLDLMRSLTEPAGVGAAGHSAGHSADHSADDPAGEADA